MLSIIRRIRTSKAVAAAVLVLAVGLPAAAQTTYHVAPCGDDSWLGVAVACAGPAGPKRTIQAAIDAASDGDTVLVADGSYTGPGNRDLDFGGRAITVRSVGGAAACIIDCGASTADPHRAFRFHSGETRESLVQGFTIRNGLMPFGGAMLCESGTAPTVVECVFEDNTAYPGATGGEGGAVRCVGSSPRFVGCRFAGNEAVRIAGVGGRGGAIQFVLGGTPSLERCVFEANTAGGGAGVHNTTGTSPTFVECDFIRNWTADPNFNGGAGYLGSGAGHTTMVNCRFIENQTARVLAGMWFTGPCTATVTGCEFIGNYGHDAGGLGFANGSRGEVTNCLFAGNRADIFSAALEVWNGLGGPGFVRMRNCTFADNTTSAGYGAIVVSQTASLVAESCVLWGDSPAAIVLLDSGAANVTHSMVAGGWPGTGNTDADPLFVGTGARPYALQPGSPGIDAGNPAFAPAPCEHDAAGACRVWDGNGDRLGRADMGAYEFAAPLGDLNADCTVGPADLNILLSHLHTPAGAAPADGDLDNDGDVDLDDLKSLMQSFGARCP